MLVEGRNPTNRLLRLSFQGKSNDTVLFERFQQGQAGFDLQRTTRGLPIEVLANGERQLIAAQVAEGLNRLLNTSQLLPGKPAPAKCRLRQALD